MRYLALTLTCLFLTACSKDPAPATTSAEANAPRPVAEQEKEIAAKLAEQKAALDAQAGTDRDKAEKARINQFVRDIAGRLDGLRAEANKTGRSDLGPVVDKLATLRVDAERVEVNDCTTKVRTTLIASIDKTIETLNNFRNQTGEADAATKKGAEEAQALLMQADAQMSACL